MRELVEVWKPVVGWEDSYMVSSLGRVKSLERVVSFGISKRVIKEKILKQHKKGTCEYYSVNLSKNGKQNWILVHRLVASHFLPNPKNLPMVNHKDEDKSNNTVDNLEWCSAQYNNTYGTIRERQINTLKKGYQENKYNINYYKKPIIQFTMDGELVRTWDSAIDAERGTGIQHRNICACCKKHKGYYSAGGSKWEYYSTDRYLIAKMKKTLKERGIVLRNAS